MTERVVDFMGLLGFAALVQAVFLGAYFGFVKIKQSKAYGLLACLLLIFAFTLLHDILVYSRYMLDYPHFLATGMAFILAIGPLIYLYIRWQTSQNFHFYWWDVLHFIPFMIGHWQRLDTYLMSANAKGARLQAIFARIAKGNAIPPLQPWQDNLSHFLFWHAQPLIYLVISIFLLNRHRTRIKERFSYTEKINLRWMQYVLYGYCVIFGLEYFLEIYPQFTGKAFWSSSSPVSISLFSIQVYIITYMGLHSQNTIALSENKESSIEKTQPVKEKKTEQVLSNQQAAQLNERLKEYMKETQAYHNSKLSIQALSEALEVSARYISFAINHQQRQNFFDFVNTYRIQEAKQLLLDDKTRNWTIAAVSEEVGFNSRDAFYRAFKKNCGMTPTQYRKQADNH